MCWRFTIFLSIFGINVVSGVDCSPSASFRNVVRVQYTQTMDKVQYNIHINFIYSNIQPIIREEEEEEEEEEEDDEAMKTY